MGMFDVFRTDTVRDSFGKALCELAQKDDSVVLVSGDSNGASKTTNFQESFHERAFNVGIAEQNMVGFASGLAYEGYKPYVSTRAPFLSMRAAEQIRTIVCYDNLPVCLVATGGGYCSGTAGATHWALEDVAIMSSLGNMTVFETGDSVLIKKILDKSLLWKAPMYIRLGMDTEEVLYSEEFTIEFGKANELIEGKDGYFIVSGTVVNFAVKAAKILKDTYNLDVGVFDMFTLKPIDREAIRKAATTGNILVAHDHNVFGGLGSLVGKVILEEKYVCNYKVLGCPDYFVPVATANYLYRKFEYDVDGLVENMKNIILGNVRE